MSFSNPTALLGALLAVPIVVLYILRVRMRRVPVSTVMFWEQVYEEKAPRSLWRQLRHLTSLLVQLLLLLLLVTALADPVFQTDAESQRRLVVVIDNSASMSCRRPTATGPTGPSRLDIAKDRAAQLIQSLKPNDEMAIITCGNIARVVCGLTDHQRTLQRRLNRLSQTEAPARVPQAIEVAERLVRDHDHAEIVVFTDGCFGEAAEIAEQPGISWVQIGEAHENIGITTLQPRRSVVDPVGLEILLEVTSFCDEARDVTVDLMLDGQLLDVYPLQLKAGEVHTELISRTSLTGGVLQAELKFDDADSADGLVADNIAYAVLPDRVQMDVILATEGNWFLQQALEANAAVRLTVVDDVPKSIAADSVLVLHRRIPDVLPPCKTFVAHPDRSCDLWQVAGAIDQPLVGSQEPDDPLLAHVRLDNVLMPEATKLVPRTEAQTLVESVAGDPLYLHFKREAGDVMVLAVNLEKGDLPLRTAFPILLSNALAAFAEDRGEFQQTLATGSSTQLDLPSDLLDAAARNNDLLTLVAPDGRESAIAVRQSSAQLPRLDQAGLWALRGSPTAQDRISSEDDDRNSESGSEYVVACNLTDNHESNLRSSVVLPNAGTTSVSKSAGRPFWFYLVVAALILTSVEWGLFHRRWIA